MSQGGWVILCWAAGTGATSALAEWAWTASSHGLHRGLKPAEWCWLWMDPWDGDGNEDFQGNQVGSDPGNFVMLRVEWVLQGYSHSSLEPWAKTWWVPSSCRTTDKRYYCQAEWMNGFAHWVNADWCKESCRGQLTELGAYKLACGCAGRKNLALVLAPMPLKQRFSTGVMLNPFMGVWAIFAPLSVWFTKLNPKTQIGIHNAKKTTSGLLCAFWILGNRRIAL